MVMLAAAAACAYQGGAADLLIGHCPAMSDAGTISLFRPWAALDILKVIGEPVVASDIPGCVATMAASGDVQSAAPPRQAQEPKMTI